MIICLVLYRISLISVSFCVSKVLIRIDKYCSQPMTRCDASLHDWRKNQSVFMRTFCWKFRFEEKTGKCVLTITEWTIADRRYCRNGQSYLLLWIDREMAEFVSPGRIVIEHEDLYSDWQVGVCQDVSFFCVYSNHQAIWRFWGTSCTDVSRSGVHCGSEASEHQDGRKLCCTRDTGKSLVPYFLCVVDRLFRKKNEKYD